MSDNVVTELVIDADTTGADAYARAMDGAEQAASKGLEAVSGFNLGLAAFGISAAAAFMYVDQRTDDFCHSASNAAAFSIVALSITSPAPCASSASDCMAPEPC